MHGIYAGGAHDPCMAYAWNRYGIAWNMYMIYMSSLFNAMQTKRDLVKNALSVGVVFVIPH